MGEGEDCQACEMFRGAVDEMVKRETEVHARRIEGLDPIEAAATLMAIVVFWLTKAEQAKTIGRYDEIVPLAMKRAHECELKVKGLYTMWRRGRWIGWRSEKVFRELAELRAMELCSWTSEGGPRPW